jgi:hypothetical protein
VPDRVAVLCPGALWLLETRRVGAPPRDGDKRELLWRVQDAGARKRLAHREPDRQFNSLPLTHGGKAQDDEEHHLHLAS